MTRPTTISPVTFHDQKIYYTEHIDIAPLLPPIPRTITLEPVARRTRGRKKASTSTDALKKKDDVSVTTTLCRQSIASSVQSTTGDEGRTSPSERSIDSRPSSNCQTSASDSLYRARDLNESGSLTNVSSPTEGKTITATVESLKGGGLRGDTIPLKIIVNHTKHIKSVNGVIITMYRHARVDMHPALPIGPTNERQQKKHDEYYPKSLTGLGGLSLSGAGSSHVFRKDLVQMIMPLMVDPQTMTAEVNAKVRIPEDCFPTISTVPGEMISFKYYIEVIVDIQGKLSGQDRYIASANEASTPVTYYEDRVGGNGFARGDRGGLQLVDNAIVDTTPIRRDKSVVTCLLEVIVGTRDSTPKKAKGKAIAAEDGKAPSPRQEQPQDQAWPGLDRPQDYAGWYDYNHDYTYQQWPAEQGSPYDGQYYYNEWPQHHPQNGLIAPPNMDHDEDLPEKERLRRAEALLLPSQPPDAGQGSTENGQPSAPVLEDDRFENRSPLASSSVISPHEYASSSAPLNGVHTDEGLTTPPYFQHNERNGESSSAAVPVDDKQELNRQQLELQASVPPTEELEHTSLEPSSGPSESFPTEDELNNYHNGTHNGHGDNLPRYER